LPVQWRLIERETEDFQTRTVHPCLHQFEFLAACQD